MAKRKNGKSFEILTKEIFEALVENPAYTKVEHNVKLPGKDGVRQIDVLLRAQVSSLSILTIIECKDENKNLDVQYVDALHSKMQDVNAHKAVLVARKGFSKTAIQKAKRVGITLCSAMEAKSALWNVGLQVPVVFTHIVPKKFDPSFEIAFLEAGTRIDSRTIALMINDTYMPEYFRERLIAREIQFTETQDIQVWYPDSLGSSHYIRDCEGNRIDIKDLKIYFQLEISYYFGYLNDLENTRALLNRTEETMHIMFEAEQIFDYRHTFARYDNIAAIPEVEGLHIGGVAMPEIQIAGVGMNLTSQTTGDSWWVESPKLLI
jgi:hypothetical protein